MGTVLLMLLFLFLTFVVVALVLLQEGKGGGLTGNAAGMDSVMGARNPLRRMTAIAFCGLVLVSIVVNAGYARAKSTTEMAPLLPGTGAGSSDEAVIPPVDPGTGVFETPALPGVEATPDAVIPPPAPESPDAPATATEPPAATEPEASAPAPSTPETEAPAPPPAPEVPATPAS